MNAQEFMGLTKKRSQDLAEKRNLIFYLIRSDNEMFLPYPTDKRDDRICVELENGKVVQAVIQ